MKKIFKKSNLQYLFFFLFTVAVIVFCVRLILDYMRYSPANSFPFYLLFVFRCVEILVPGTVFLILGLIFKKKYGIKKEKKKISAKKLITVIAAAILALAVILTVVPGVILHFVINNRCDYLGKETKAQALQGIYKPEDFGLTATEHYFDTSDGERIWASEVSCDAPRAVVIYLSGIMQPSVTYFYGHSAIMKDIGVASFLTEVRSHGKSTGNKLGLGYTEIEDVRCVVEYIKSQSAYDGLPIIIQGVSMGGAISINSFGEIPDISACVAMSPYSSFENELDLLMKEYFVPKFLRDYEMIFLREVLYLNFGRDAVCNKVPVKEIVKADKRPILIMANKNDRDVPIENTYALLDAYGAETFIRNSWEHFIIRGCDFAGVADDTEYTEVLCDFIEKVINK